MNWKDSALAWAEANFDYVDGHFVDDEGNEIDFYKEYAENLLSLEN